MTEPKPGQIYIRRMLRDGETRLSKILITEISHTSMYTVVHFERLNLRENSAYKVGQLVTLDFYERYRMAGQSHDIWAKLNEN